MDYVRHVLAALASACLIAACGGADGDDDLAFGTTSSPSSASAPSEVRVEGCVLDDAGPAVAVPVHARGEDGRLLASAASNDRGVYTMRLPAQHSVALSTALSGPPGLLLLTGRSDLSIGGCLRRGAD